MTETPSATPRVSLVMGVYNGEDALAETLDSLIAQVFGDFELIVVDDGSTDRTSQILTKYYLWDDRVKIISQNNLGLTRALSVGCGLARGEFIARQDVGDTSEPHRLAKQVEYLDQNPSVVAVGTGCRRVGPKGEDLSVISRNLSPQRITQALLQNGVGISHTVATFRRSAYEAVGGYRPQFRYAQDIDLWYRLSNQGLFAELPDLLFRWKIETEGISADRYEQQQQLAELAAKSHRLRCRGQCDTHVLREAEVIGKQRNQPCDRRGPAKKTADMNYLIGSELLRKGDRRGRNYLVHSIRNHPFRLRPWVKLAESCLIAADRPTARVSQPS